MTIDTSAVMDVLMFDVPICLQPHSRGCDSESIFCEHWQAQADAAIRKLVAETVVRVLEDMPCPADHEAVCGRLAYWKEQAG